MASRVGCLYLEQCYEVVIMLRVKLVNMISVFELGVAGIYVIRDVEVSTW